MVTARWRFRRSIREAMRWLDQLEPEPAPLVDVDQSVDPGVAALGSLKSLQTLHLDQTPTTGSGLKSLAGR